MVGPPVWSGQIPFGRGERTAADVVEMSVTPKCRETDCTPATLQLGLVDTGQLGASAVGSLLPTDLEALLFQRCHQQQSLLKATWARCCCRLCWCACARMCMCVCVRARACACMYNLLQVVYLPACTCMCERPWHGVR